jgi:hypothetical protein
MYIYIHYIYIYTYTNGGPWELPVNVNQVDCPGLGGRPGNSINSGGLGRFSPQRRLAQENHDRFCYSHVAESE